MKTFFQTQEKIEGFANSLNINTVLAERLLILNEYDEYLRRGGDVRTVLMSLINILQKQVQQEIGFITYEKEIT